MVEIRLYIARIEVQVVSEPVIVVRARPIVAELNGKTRRKTIMRIANCREENSLVIKIAGKQDASKFPLPGTSSQQLVKLCFSGHAPDLTTIDGSGIIVKFQLGLIVDITNIFAIFSSRCIIPLIVIQAIVLLWRGLTPSKQ